MPGVTAGRSGLDRTRGFERRSDASLPSSLRLSLLSFMIFTSAIAGALHAPVMERAEAGRFCSRRARAARRSGQAKFAVDRPALLAHELCSIISLHVRVSVLSRSACFTACTSTRPPTVSVISDVQLASFPLAHSPFQRPVATRRLRPSLSTHAAALRGPHQQGLNTTTLPRTDSGTLTRSRCDQSTVVSSTSRVPSVSATRGEP